MSAATLVIVPFCITFVISACAQAALLGQMTAGFPVSPLTPATFLVAGLCGLELSAHQRYAFPFLYAASLCMALACVVLGVFPV